MRKNLQYIVFIFLICINVIFTGNTVLGALDKEAPLLVKFGLMNNAISAGDTLTMDLDVEEDGTGITVISVEFESEAGDRWTINYYPVGDEKYTGSFSIREVVPDTVVPGTYSPVRLIMSDAAENGREYGYGNEVNGYDKFSAEEGVICELTSPYTSVNIENELYIPVERKSDPRILDVQLLNFEVTRDECIYADVTITDENGNVSDDIVMPKICLYYESSDRLEQSGYDPSEQGMGAETYKVLGEGKYRYEFHLDRSFEMIGTDERFGNFTITGISAVWKDGDYIGNLYSSKLEKEDDNYYFWNYVGNKKRRCFLLGQRNFKINPANELDSDIEIPIVEKLSVRNQTVSKPGVVYLDYTVTDNYSLMKMSVSFSHRYKGQGFSKTIILQTGRKEISGTIEIEIPLTAATGKYILSDIQLWDEAGNWLMLSPDEAGEVVFSTPNRSFTVIPSDDAFFEVVDETDEVAFETSLSNSKILSKLSTMNTGETGRILIDSSTNTIARRELFQNIKDRDVKIVFYKDYYQWVFSGTDITAPKDIDLQMTVEIIDGTAFEEEGKLLRVTFADNGVLPGKALVRIKSDYTKKLFGIKGRIYLYYENEETGNAELQNNANPEYIMDGSDHWCSFEITHNSSFIISGKALKKVKNTVTKSSGGNDHKSSSTDKTSDAGPGNANKTDKTLAAKPVTSAGTDKTPAVTSDTADTNNVPAPLLVKKNTLSVKARIVTIKRKKIKKKPQTVKISKAMKIKGAHGKVSYKLLGVKKKKFKKYFKVNKKTGKITIKKGLKKGIYRIKILVKDAGNRQFKAEQKKVTIKIKVK